MFDRLRLLRVRTAIIFGRGSEHVRREISINCSTVQRLRTTKSHRKDIVAKVFENTVVQFDRLRENGPRHTLSARRNGQRSCIAPKVRQTIANQRGQIQIDDHLVRRVIQLGCCSEIFTPFFFSSRSRIFCVVPASSSTTVIRTVVSGLNEKSQHRQCVGLRVRVNEMNFTGVVFPIAKRNSINSNRRIDRSLTHRVHFPNRNSRPNEDGN